MTDIFKALAEEREPIKPSIEKATFSAADLYADLGLSPTQENSPTNKTSLEGKNFLTAQYPILSTPYFLIYLQGPALFVDSLPPTDSLEYITAFFTNAKIRKLGRAKTTPAISKLVTLVLNGDYKRFYTDKDFHLNALRILVEAGANIDKTKCLNRPAMLASIASYLEDLSTFLASKGFDSNREYIEASPQTIREGNKLTLDDLEHEWDSL